MTQTIFTSYVRWKFPGVRPILDGEPLILVQDGRVIDRNLRRERLTHHEIAEAARINAQIESLDEVKWAVLETNGQISFVKKTG